MAVETRGNNNEEQPRRFNNGEAILRGDEDPRIVSGILPEAKEIAESYGFDEDAAYKIEIIFQEAVTNGLKYGSKGDPSKPVKVELTFDKQTEEFVIRVIDQGPGFAIDKVPDPLAEENLLNMGGRGILLMKSWAEKVSSTMTPEGHVLEVRKKLVKKEPTQ